MRISKTLVLVTRPNVCNHGAYRVCLPGGREITCPVQQLYLLGAAHMDVPAGEDVEYNKEEVAEMTGGHVNSDSSS